MDNSRTQEAYNKIVNGDADIIFVAQPSDGQKKRAELSLIHIWDLHTDCVCSRDDKKGVSHG